MQDFRYSFEQSEILFSLKKLCVVTLFICRLHCWLSGLVH
jgi:hypothetical protein